MGHAHSEDILWRRRSAAFGDADDQSPHRTRYALPIPNDALRDAASGADLGLFLAIGEAWAQVALAFMPVERPTVVDIGCGCGKMARFLVAHPNLHFIGLDVFEPAIIWCKAAFAPRYGDRVRFELLDIQSELYNITGAVRGETVTLPLGSATVDFVICASLFTHLLEKEMQRYLKEISRILRPGGRMLASIHNEPKNNARFSGDVTRIDMTDKYFLESSQAVGLQLFENVGNLYGQQTYILQLG